MPTKVFISYRRDDGKYQARMIYTAFRQVLPDDRVFMDVDSIRPGDDFVKILEGWVDKCDIQLALIGTGWLAAADPKTGRRRLDDPDDFVRIEVRKALVRGIPVLPVLLDGASMPDADELPHDMKKLVRRHAEFVQYRSFDADVKRLIRKLGLGRGERPPADKRIEIDAAIVKNANGQWFLPGAGKTEWFEDHNDGPEMVVVPACEFQMGSPDSEPERLNNEGPQHPVMIAVLFAVGRHAVTRGQFAAFVKATGHKSEGGAYLWTGKDWTFDLQGSWRNPGFAQDDTHPVVCVNWHDARAYVEWLDEISGSKGYRLLSEAEWEYACRAGTTTPFWWGSSITPEQANYDANYTYAGGWANGEWRKSTVPVDSFDPNPWGLYQVHGNVWVWCEDCWHESYEGAPYDGSAWTALGCEYRVVRGGSWDDNPGRLRSACRSRGRPEYRFDSAGLWVARTL